MRIRVGIRLGMILDKQNKGKYNKKELSQAYEKSGLKSSKNAIYDPKFGKKWLFIRMCGIENRLKAA